MTGLGLRRTFHLRYSLILAANSLATGSGNGQRS
ncbi:hypothetical protein RHECNPAF_12210065 [Rhizobium etli CNPAF512]|nr:hypothetical protein RHECNPAF_12210065 [Rhizobium etli CNPAF512]